MISISNITKDRRGSGIYERLMGRNNGAILLSTDDLTSLFKMSWLLGLSTQHRYLETTQLNMKVCLCGFRLHEFSDLFIDY